MKIDNSEGWTEAVIDENCSIYKFYKIAEVLQTIVDISFTNKISDLDSSYWDFIYMGKELTSHYNIFAGVSIFPKSLADATNSENQVVLSLSKALSEKKRNSMTR